MYCTYTGRVLVTFMSIQITSLHRERMRATRKRHIAYIPSILSLFQHLRLFIAIDACHTMSRYRLMLMIAAMIDGNGQIVPLGVVSEAYEGVF